MDDPIPDHKIKKPVRVRLVDRNKSDKYDWLIARMKELSKGKQDWRTFISDAVDKLLNQLGELKDTE